jgi:TolA-binding protein
MNNLPAWTLLALFLTLPACGPDQAAQMLETAQFEERQTNLAHAKELYEDIIRHYPESPAAKTARTRLAELKDNP